MSGAHTPGWFVVDWGWPDYLDGIQSQYAVKANERPVAYAFDADEARLIAAAPDLLASLKAILPAVDAYLMSGGVARIAKKAAWQGEVARAQAAIAKATASPPQSVTALGRGEG